MLPASCASSGGITPLTDTKGKDNIHHRVISIFHLPLWCVPTWHRPRGETLSRDRLGLSAARCCRLQRALGPGWEGLAVGGGRWKILSVQLQLNGASSWQLCFCPFSAGRRAHCGVGPTATARLNSKAESRSKNFIYTTATSPSSFSSHPDSQHRVSACYGFVFVHLCLLSFSQNTHIHTLVSVLSCQSSTLHARVQAVPTSTLRRSVVRRGTVMSWTATRFPLAPSATEEPTFRCALCGPDETWQRPPLSPWLRGSWRSRASVRQCETRLDCHRSSCTFLDQLCLILLFTLFTFFLMKSWESKMLDDGSTHKVVWKSG